MKIRIYFCLIATFLLVFSSVFTPYVKASNGKEIGAKVEQTDLNEKEKNELKRHLEALKSAEKNVTKEEIDQYINDFVKEESEYQTRVLPYLASLVLRTGTAYFARISAGASVNVGKHTTNQALKRKITSKQLDEALSNGRRYYDGKSGARVVHDRVNEVSVIIDRYNNKTITTIDRTRPKPHWKPSLWLW